MTTIIRSEDRPVVWGIIGTGFIASHFARDIALCPNARLAAVCSRDAGTAAQFERQFQLERSFDDVNAMAADPALDAVVITSPNNAHFDHAMTMLNAGKHILIEKPIALTVGQVTRLADVASEKGLFAMEGLWTVFLPAIAEVRALLENKAIGSIRHVRAELAYEKPYDPQSRFFSEALGGGALFDLGVYPLALAHALFGPPRHSSGTWRAAESGVDISAHVELDYGTFQAEFACSFEHDGTNRFVIEGDKGVIVIAAPFIGASQVFIARSRLALSLAERSGQGRLQRGLSKAAAFGLVPGLSSISAPRRGYGLSHEIDAASAAIRAGHTQEPRMPLSASISVLSVIEALLQTRPS